MLTAVHLTIVLSRMKCVITVISIDLAIPRGESYVYREGEDAGLNCRELYCCVIFYTEYILNIDLKVINAELFSDVDKI